MKSGNRIHRHLRIEELEPRVAPATGLWVTSVAPGGDAGHPFDKLDVTFSGNVLDGTFTTGDITFTGTGGAPITVQAVNKLAKNQDEIVATGSGSPMAYGVLEDRYRPDLGEQEAVDLAVRALRAAMRRDIASGEDINVVVITKEKFEEFLVENGQKHPISASA